MSRRRCAADIIDWSDLGRSIFDRKKPLADNTLARIVEGIRRYVLNDPSPFLLPVAQAIGHEAAVGAPIVTKMYGDNRRSFVGGQRVDVPLGSPTTIDHHAIATPLFATVGYGEREGQRPRVQQVTDLLNTCVNGVKQIVVSPVLAGAGGPGYAGKPVRADQPLGTPNTENHRALVSTVLSPMTMSAGGPECQAEPVDRTLGTVLTRDHRAIYAPVLMHNTTGHTGGRVDEAGPTVTTGGQTCLVCPAVTTLRNNTGPVSVGENLHGITSGGTHASLVAALMIKYYGTQSGAHRPDLTLGTPTTNDRHGLVCVMIHGTEYVIVDILFRMLKPSELAAAMGFPDSYIWPKTQRDAVKLIGNAVSPPMAEALVRANFPNGMRSRKAVGA